MIMLQNKYMFTYCEIMKQNTPDCKMYLYTIDIVPDYLRINPYVTTGYRLLSSHYQAAKSLFYNHNCLADTLTSMAVILHACLLYFFFSPQTPVFAMHMLNGLLHAPPSAAYHLFGCSGMGEKWFFFYQSLDYIFIFISSFPLLIALGWATPGYPLNLAVVILCVLCLSVAKRLLEGHRYTASDRLVDMLSLVSCHSAPVLYARSWWIVPIMCSYAIGGWLYAYRIPERYVHGTWWTSHAYMHIMLNVAYNCQFQYLKGTINQ